MTRWGMVIDLQKCIGCRTCEAACHQMNKLPSGTFWREVADLEINDIPDHDRMFLPFGCMHCQDPPCLDVCPTTATFLQPNGIVDVDYGLCIGCGYCVVACPYLAREITKIDNVYYQSEVNGLHPLSPEANRSGVSTKCNFCLPRIEEGLSNGLKPGHDLRATPACVAFCPTEAMSFGDLNDPSSNVSKLIEGKTTIRLSEEMNTEPFVYYAVDSSLNIPGNKQKVEFIKPVKQSVWRGPAAINFVLGGLGAGLYLYSFLLDTYGLIMPQEVKLISVSLLVIGFLSLTIEAGRPSRFIYLIRHLRRSWMSWETLMAMIFIPAATIDWLYPNPIIQLIALVGALGFVIAQGMIVYRARAVPTWNMPLIPVFFISTSIMMAGGLTLMLNSFTASGVEIILIITAMIFTAFDFFIWLWYIQQASGDHKEITKSIRCPKQLMVIGGVGHGLPFLLLAFGIVTVSGENNVLIFTAALAGLLVLLCGATEKAGVILKTGYLKAITGQY